MANVAIGRVRVLIGRPAVCKRFVGRNKRTIVSRQICFCIIHPMRRSDRGMSVHARARPICRPVAHRYLPALIAAALALPTSPLPAQDRSIPATTLNPAATPSYADLADLVIAAPVIADATIRSASRLKPVEAPGLAPGMTRYYVEADVTALVRGAGGVPPRIGYLLDTAPDAAGRQPKLKKARVLLMARAVAATPGQVQLVAPDAQLPWTPDTDSRVRTIAAAVAAGDAPPRITGVGNAFHVPGALPGEGETQVFLTTDTGAPVSLTILRRPGEQPRWAVALSEIVDEAAGPPPRDTLLWYRLACALPMELPNRSAASLAPADAAIAREDYAFVLAALGACGRTRTIS